MIGEIIDSKLGRIRSDLEQRGLTYDALQDDLLDHVCCMVEERMIDGEDFDASYDEVLSSIGEHTLAGLQHETLLLLDQKFQRMKNTTYGIGLSGAVLTIIGAIMKTFHLPGASIVLVSGFFLVTAVFLPLYFILSYREQVEKPAVIYPVIGYLTLAVVLIGTVFKIMHWPGANIMLQAGLVITLIAFLPLFIVRLFKRAEGRKINPAYVIMLLIGISVVVALTRVNISKVAIDYYTDLIEINLESAETIRSASDALVEGIPDSLVSAEVKKVIGFSDELESAAGEMLTGLLSTVDQAGVPIRDATGRDYRNARWQAIVKTGDGDKYRKLCKEYSTYLTETIKDPVALIQVRNNMVFASDNWVIRFEPDEIRFEPLVVTYHKITNFDNEIAICEYLALQSMLGNE